MSIKIYNGMLSTIADPFEVGIAARKVLEPLFFQKVDVLVDKIKEVPEEDSIEDSLFLDFNPEEGMESRKYREEFIAFDIVNTLNLRMRRTLSEWDFGYTVSLIPNGLSKGSNPLALIFSEDAGFYYALMESGIFESFGYWDNTDPEDGADWEERRKVWSYLIDRDAAPSNVGLTFSHPSRLDYRMYKQGLTY